MELMISSFAKVITCMTIAGYSWRFMVNVTVSEFKSPLQKCLKRFFWEGISFVLIFTILLHINSFKSKNYSIISLFFNIVIVLITLMSIMFNLRETKIRKKKIHKNLFLNKIIIITEQHYKLIVILYGILLAVISILYISIIIISVNRDLNYSFSNAAQVLMHITKTRSIHTIDNYERIKIIYISVIVSYVLLYILLRMAVGSIIRIAKLRKKTRYYTVVMIDNSKYYNLKFLNGTQEYMIFNNNDNKIVLFKKNILSITISSNPLKTINV